MNCESGQSPGRELAIAELLKRTQEGAAFATPDEPPVPSIARPTQLSEEEERPLPWQPKHMRVIDGLLDVPDSAIRPHHLELARSD